MTVNMQPNIDVDEAPMDRLRKLYVEQGFHFIAHPREGDLPAFMGDYRPDAIAVKSGMNVAFQFLRPRNDSREPSLEEIRRLFIGHPDWRLVVSHSGIDPSMTEVFPSASEASIRAQLEELRKMARQGQGRAAFVMGWSLLEAVLHRRDEEGNRRPRNPGTVLETLARLGYLSPELETKLRPLTLLRNRIVHGDIGAQPTADDLDAVFSAIDEALT